MGSTGKVAFGTILGIGAITGILCYFAFSLVAPEPGIMTYVSREPPADTATSARPLRLNLTTECNLQVMSLSQMPLHLLREVATVTARKVMQQVAMLPRPPLASLQLGSTSSSTYHTSGCFSTGNPAFEPDPLTVKVGDTIAVENKDTTPHTVTNGKDATDPNMGKLFDTSIINAGDSADVVTADLKPGEYPLFLFCASIYDRVIDSTIT